MIHRLISAIEKLIAGGARAPNGTNSIDQKGEVRMTDVSSETDKTTKLVKSGVEQVSKTPKQIIVFRTVLLLVVVGIMIIIFANFLEVDNMIAKSTTSQFSETTNLQSNSPAVESPFITIESALEQRTKDILEKMIGVGNVNVLITVESTEEQIIELNKNESKSVTQETDKNGGVREVTTTTNDGQVVFMETGGEQGPVVTKIINPRIRGVLIVAEGAEDATVRKLIIQAVEKGLNVHSTKISVVPSKI